MKHTYRGAAAFALILFASGLISRGGALPERPEATDPDIVIHFHGLMVFTANGRRISAYLHSNAPDHVALLQVKSPGMTQFQNVKVTRKTKVEILVVNNDGTLADTAGWVSTPFQIRDLHSSGPRQLICDESKFGPSVTVNAGTFCGTEMVEATFFTNCKELPKTVAGAVEASVTLGPGQKATFRVNNKQLGPMLEAGSGPHVIEVSNGPKYGSSTCYDYHFVHYYDGFYLYDNGKRTSVPKSERYKVKKTGVQANASCVEMQSIETRPCIPAMYP